jgi:hypothetical protein
VTDSVPGLCLFWNYRALRTATSLLAQEGRRTFLLPTPWLAGGRAIEGLCRFIRSVPALPNVSSELDLIVSCFDGEETWQEVRRQLAALPGVEIPESARLGASQWSGHPDRVPREADPERVLRCGFTRPPVCTSYQEGAGRRPLPTKVPLDRGTNEILLEPPEGFRNEWRGGVAVDIICDLWQDYPRDPAVAGLIRQGAWFSPYGVSTELEVTGRPQYVPLNVPAPWEALLLYFQRRGYVARRSAPARYADALLGLVGGLPGAEVFASVLAYRLLDSLAMKSSKKVAQRITKELRLASGAEEDLTRLLRDADVVSELKKVPKTLQELCGLGDRRALLALLGRLAEAGVVQRGFHATCPECQTPSWFPLRAVQERLVCPGCSASFLLPVEHPAGSSRELAWEYTLNALVNRAVDQDVLPAILALRHEAQGQRMPFFVAGLELALAGEADAEAELDYLFVRDQGLYAGECKAGAELSDKDVRTGRLAAALGVKEFSFCTVRKFSDTALGLVESLRAELREAPNTMAVKVLTGEELLGGVLS